MSKSGPSALADPSSCDRLAAHHSAAMSVFPAEDEPLKFVLPPYVATRLYVPALSFQADSLQDPLPDDSVILQSVVMDIFTVTVPVGIVPANWGEIATERRSVCSWP